MSATGIMDEIRELLSQGKTSREVIALGHKPSTVYKVQRQVRKRDERSDLEQTPARDIMPEADSSQPDAEVTELRRRVSILEAELTEAQARIAELDAEAESAAVLSDKVDLLHVEAQSWQGKVAEDQKALDDANLQLADARAVIQTLKPLTVWVGHPCCVCGQATDGVLNQASAATLLERVGHRDCLQQAGLKKVTFAALALVQNQPSLPTSPGNSG